MASTRSGFFIVVLCMLSVRISAQHITEYPFPPLPLPGISAGIIASDNGFIIHGINSDSWYSQIFDWGGAMYRPYYIPWDGKQLHPPVFLPDTMYADYYGFSFQSDRWKIATVIDSMNDPFVMWSSVRNYMSDVPPTYLGSTERSYAVSVNGTLQKAFTDVHGMNPSIAPEKSEVLHCVWESVHAETISTYLRHFTTYSSEVLYKIIGFDGSQYHDIPQTIGKGFYPEIKLRNAKPYILFFAADSSSSKTFSLQVNQGSAVILSEKVKSDTTDNPFPRPTPLIMQQPLLQSFSWDVDTGGGIHAVWFDDDFDNRKIHILHSRPGFPTYTDTSIKLTSAYGEIRTRYMNDGEVRMVIMTTWGTILYYTSSYGSPAVERKAIPLNSSTALLRSFFTDRNGNDHALVEAVNGLPGLSVIKYVNTDSSRIILLSKDYSAGTSVFVDTAQTVWLTGRRDSTAVLLSFNLDDIESQPDFIFPLRAGNEWHYSVYGEPPNGSPILSDIQAMRSDTLAGNGRRYIVLTSRMLPHRYFRKEGLKIFQYVPKDTAEYLRFDFSLSAGDTVFVNHAEPYRSVTVQTIEPFSPFGSHLRTFTFAGSVDPFGQDGTVKVCDSVGIIYSAAVGPTWVLTGAKVNGTQFGQILSAGDAGTPLLSVFALSQNYPNPFNPSTTFDYQVPVRSFVTITIYDVIGRTMTMLVNEEKNAGVYSIPWNAGGYSTGMYFARMTAGKFSTVKKLILMK